MPDNNALHAAAKDGNLVEVQAQVSNFDVNAKGQNCVTALVWAARRGHTEVVKLILTYNPDVNIPDVSILKMMVTCHPLCNYPIPHVFKVHLSLTPLAEINIISLSSLFVLISR